MDSYAKVTTAVVAVLFLAAGQLAGQQSPVFEATVARVRVDVIVTDAQGRFVDDLHAEDFVVGEDGDVQDVLAFQLVDLSGSGARGSAADKSIDAGSETRVAARAGADSRTASPAQEQSSTLGAMVFLIDFPGLDWKNKARFVGVWQDMLAETDALGIPRAVYLIDQVGRLEELAPLTFDVGRLREAVGVVGTTPLLRRGVHEQLVLGREGELRASDFEERARSRATLRLLTQFCNALTARQGRTALVWVTSELQTMEGGPFAALRAATWEKNNGLDASFANDRSRRSGNTPFAYLFPDTGVLDLEEEFYRAANSANVSIYTIDPTPQTEWRSIALNVGVATPGDAELLSGFTVQASLDGLRDELRHAATETGGRSFIGWSDLHRVLPEIERDTGRFYLLTYAAPAPQGDGDYHAISVDVRRDGLRVRARQGYTDLPAAERQEQTMAAALALPGTVTGLAVHARAVRRWTATGAPVVQLLATVDLATLVGSSTRFTDQARPLEFRAVAVADNDRIAAEIRQEVLPHVPDADVGEGAAPRTAGSGDTPGAPARPFVYVHDWTLDPGSYDIRVAVRDAASGKLGATRMEVVVRESSPDWQTSDLMLLAGNDQQPRPLATDTLAAGDVLTAYLEVANGEQPVLSGDLFTAGGSSRIAQLPSVAMNRDPAGIHRGALRLRGLEPGAYVLQVAVTDAAVGKHAFLRANVNVVSSARSR